MGTVRAADEKRIRNELISQSDANTKFLIFLI